MYSFSSKQNGQGKSQKTSPWSLPSQERRVDYDRDGDVKRRAEWDFGDPPRKRIPAPATTVSAATPRRSYLAAQTSASGSRRPTLHFQARVVEAVVPRSGAIEKFDSVSPIDVETVERKRAISEEPPEEYEFDEYEDPRAARIRQEKLALVRNELGRIKREDREAYEMLLDVVGATKDPTFTFADALLEGDVSPAKRARTPDEYSPVVVAEDDICVEKEEEFRSDIPPFARSCRLTDLRECIRNGVLDMAHAARVLHSLRVQQNITDGSYEEFVRYAASYGVKKMCFMGFKEIMTFEEYRDLNTEATQLMADITMAKSALLTRKLLPVTLEPSTLPSTNLTFSVSNCTRPWYLDADKPFLKLDLVAEATSWTAKSRESTVVQTLSLFRYLLRKITDPPEKIKEYAVRLNGRCGRDDKLKNLPGVVERTLLDFAEDMLGYGRDELQFGAVFDRSKSRFFMSLGETEEERDSAYEGLVAERSLWRKQLMKSLQRALSDVRSMRCEFAMDKDQREVH